jgi:hypothetical protein
MTQSEPRRPASAEDIAVPKVDLFAELIEGLGEAAAALLPDKPVDASPKHPAASAHPVDEEASGSRAGTKRLAVLQYPKIDSETPLGPSPGNPMGEGSEDTAVPTIDPADARLGQLHDLPDPLP